MTLTAIILLILLGIVFMLLEILVIPGVGVVGVIGFVLMAAGIYFAYELDTNTGHIALAVSAVMSGGLIWLALRAKTWERVSLKSELGGKAPAIEDEAIHVGDTGVAISRLAPMGKARINGQLLEVTSTGILVDEGSAIKIIKIEGKKVIVGLDSAQPTADAEG